VAAVLGGMGGALYGVRSHDSAPQAQLMQKMTRLQAQIASDETAIGTDQRAVSNLTNQVTTLNSKVASPNVPTDPLSSCDEVCTIYSGSALGNSLNWYLPCATNVETIPQPG
jgi:hypothetical protein